MILRIDRLHTELPPPSTPDPAGAAVVQERRFRLPAVIDHDQIGALHQQVLSSFPPRRGEEAARAARACAAGTHE